MLKEYFNSKSLKLEEPKLTHIEWPIGDVIHTWNSPDGWRTITRNSDKTYTLWNLENIQPISSFGDTSKTEELFTRNYQYNNHCVQPFGHISEVTDFAITPDGKTAVTALGDSTCIIWDVLNSKPIMRIVGFSTGSDPIAITRDGKKLVMSQLDPFWND